MTKRPTPIRDAILRDRPIAKAIVEGLEAAAKDPNAAITPTAVDTPVVDHVVAAVEASPTVAAVEVKSGWLSKVNWTQAVGIVATGLAWIGLDVPPETLLEIVAGIQAVVAVATVIMKTFFTKTVTPQSAGK